MTDVHRCISMCQVVSDPQILKHILREKVFNYDKGVPNSADSRTAAAIRPPWTRSPKVLGEVLEDVMGKGQDSVSLEGVADP